MSSKKEEIKMWSSKVEGKCRVFGNEITYGKGKNKKSFTKFSTSISQKNENDEYINFFIEVGFKKGEEPEVEETGVVINIINGFLTCYDYENKDGESVIKPKLVVMEWEEFESEDKKKNENKKIHTN